MGKKTQRAVLLNKDGDISTFINKEDFNNFLNEFLKISKKKMTLPPTAFEKTLIVAKPIEENNKKKNTADTMDKKLKPKNKKK